MSQTRPVEVTHGTQLGRLGPALLCCQPLVHSDECTQRKQKSPQTAPTAFLIPQLQYPLLQYIPVEHLEPIRTLNFQMFQLL